MPKPCPEGREVKGGQNPPNQSDYRPPKPGGSQPLGFVLSDALDMLEAVYKAWDRNRSSSVCHFCSKLTCQNEYGVYWQSHEQDCLYLKIETYLKEFGRL